MKSWKRKEGTLKIKMLWKITKKRVKKETENINQLKHWSFCTIIKEVGANTKMKQRKDQNKKIITCPTNKTIVS